MIDECVVVVINGMLMNCAVRMLMGDDVVVMPAFSVVENKAKIVVAGVAGRRFRRRHKYTLECKRDRRRQHYRDRRMLQR
jgi:hypothetical protein